MEKSKAGTKEKKSPDSVNYPNPKGYWFALQALILYYCDSEFAALFTIQSHWKLAHF